MSADLTTSIAETVRAAREAHGLSAAALAERSGVSRAMIAKVERAEAQPTAALLGRLSAALGLTLSELVARAEQSDRRLVRAAEQPVWTDPETGYRRRAVSPVSGGPLELVEVELPEAVEIAYPADSYAFIHQQIWVLEGALTIREDGVEHALSHGDCLEFGAPSARVFVARTACRYLVALTRR
ncbi:XRE family transcriptional regulator [Solirubrobacter phytolaccae]|uniref:XRE family transcriptional regulator n=1 Tax=Solirubrobacter phytolaccae TaxID=1404360 RepID=A0A9X3SGY4_9ACTN|nr:XRE family transcriptional regulator [Solirubrobacter phytolaccae]MDA0182852.1 XRE family transcriptional regulator [Solirubrobacter phytolaccae]